MNCEEYRQLLVLRLCGEMEAEDEVKLQEHLEGCEECRESQKEFRAMLALMKQMPDREWDERLRIRDLIRRNQRWRAVVFSKAAIWILALTGLITVLTVLPLRWELSAQEFSLRWGAESSREADLAREMKQLQVQLADLQKQNQDWQQTSEDRLRQLVNVSNVEQQKRYFQTLELFTNYLQLQRRADMQRIQKDIATSYDRTGHEVDKTNELLDYVLKASASGDASIYDRN